MSVWYLYIIETTSGKLYTGITTDLERRFKQHKTGKGAKFFHKNIPKKIVYTEEHPDRSLASKRECAIKKMTRKAKLALINPNPKD